MIKLQHLFYFIGRPEISGHIDAVHAASPKSDQFTGEIVGEVVKSIDTSAIIGTLSRLKMDINRNREKKNAPAIDEFRSAIKAILGPKKILDRNGQLKRNYLHLAIHGMKDEHKVDFVVGTLKGDSCSPEVERWFVSQLKKLSTNIWVNKRFSGHPSKSVHRHGDGTFAYPGYGDKFHTIQLEINRSWRKKKQLELVDFFSRVLTTFDNNFNNK